MAPDKITIHCSAGKNGRPYPIKDMRADHIKNRGFSDVGYHYVIQPDGTAEIGRPLNTPGAHVKDHNKGNIGVCLIGTDKFTDAQFTSLRNVLNGIMMTYPIKKTEIYCHNQFDSAIKEGKSCPNIPINAILVWYYQIAGEQTIAPFKLKE